MLLGFIARRKQGLPVFMLLVHEGLACGTELPYSCTVWVPLLKHSCVLCAGPGAGTYTKRWAESEAEEINYSCMQLNPT